MNFGPGPQNHLGLGRCRPIEMAREFSTRGENARDVYVERRNMFSVAWRREGPLTASELFNGWLCGIIYVIINHIA